MCQQNCYTPALYVPLQFKELGCTKASDHTTVSILFVSRLKFLVTKSSRETRYLRTDKNTRRDKLGMKQQECF
jgi:hypothetical protein